MQKYEALPLYDPLRVKQSLHKNTLTIYDNGSLYGKMAEWPKARPC